MRKPTILFFSLITALLTFANLPLIPFDVKWDESYTFDKRNDFVVEFYAKGNDLMKTTSLQNDGNYTVSFKAVEMTVAVNKVNYYTF